MHKNRNKNRTQSPIKGFTKSTVNLSGNAIGKKATLSGADTQNIEKVTKFMVDVIRRQRRLWRKELNDWQASRFARYQAEVPKTYLMQELYQDVMLDGHLTGITGNRTLRTTNKDYIFTIDGIKDDALTELIKDKEWFENIIQWAHESTYYGYSLIWVKDFEKGNIKEVELIERGLVVPEHKVLLYDINADKGIDYSTIKDILLYAQFYDNVGLLEKAAVYTILKRHSWGSWDEFEELFGIPIRIAKIASQSETVKNEVAGWLEEMGSAPYGVFPIGTEVDIKENSKTDSFNVFFQKIKALDAELSKLVLHQTMTTENGSSRAQGSVHENTLEEVIYADEKKELAFLNNRLVPAMRLLGYKIPDKAKIAVEKTTDPNDQIKIDGVLLGAGYVLTQDYIEETYGVEVESMPGANQEVKNPDNTKKALGLLKLHYRTHCCGEHEPIKLSKEDDDLSRLIEVYLRQLFDDRAVSSENQKKLWEYYFNELSQAVDAGYKPNPEMYDPALAHSLKYNIAQFSAFKETSFRKQLEAALTKDGKILPWGEFKAVADELHIEYNRRWLKTEYHHTVAVANMAEKWQEFEADADLYPNLKIVTAGDARVRESHKILDGLTLPVNHPFWKSHTPPFDWGCRCGIVQTDEEASEKIPNFKFKKEHENNPYYSGQIFNGNPYELGLIPGDKKEAKSKAAKYFNNKVLQSDRSEQFKTLSTTKKGKVLEHLLTKKGGDYNDIIKTATEFSKMGKTAELMPEINEKEKTIRSLIFPNLKSKTSNPDLKVGNLFFDIKRPKAIKNILGNANGASKQGAIAVISDSQLDKPLTDKIMQNRAIHIFKDKNYQFDQVIFLKDGKLIIFNRKGV